MKRKMMDKFRDAENERLKKALSSGKVENADKLISDENSKLQAKNEVLQAQADSIKVLSPLFIHHWFAVVHVHP